MEAKALNGHEQIKPKSSEGQSSDWPELTAAILDDTKSDFLPDSVNQFCTNQFNHTKEGHNRHHK